MSGKTPASTSASTRLELGDLDLLRGYMGKRFLAVGVGGMGGGSCPGRASRDYDFDATAEEIDVDGPRLTKPN